ncbi:MAG: OsmC family protein [Anaerolineae bacterium]|nr:OsmC family protein [Anaerolineae bacterium]
MAVRTAQAVWNKGLKDGNGRMRFGSGAFDGQYSFSSRFEEGTGTNPEELIGAAHAGCFSMAFSADLERAGFPPERVETTARVHLTKGESGFSISKIELITEADVPGISEADFQAKAAAAKANCPVSRALAGVEITVSATLVS